MQSKLLHEADGKRTFAVILQNGDEAMRCLQDFAGKERLGGAQVTAIGALSGAKLAFFDWETKQYRPIPVEEQVEVASLIGDIAVGPDGKPSVHVHAVLGRRDGTALAGHLQAGYVRPTLEIIITESPAHLCKVKDAESGLALISARK
jgi:predicted DNA-binding protein with PD1-like motif